MQIVIDVPEDAHGRIVRPDRIFTDDDINAVVWAVYNGIELPKGHGRLIDVDNIQEITLEDSLTELTHKKGDDINCYIEAPTVLEADNVTKAQ